MLILLDRKRDLITKRREVQHPLDSHCPRSITEIDEISQSLVMLLRLVFLIASCQSILNPDCRNSIRNTYGDQRAIALNRADLGPNGDGSFGGGKFPLK